MWLTRRPSDQRISDFLNHSRGLPLSYDPIGLAQSPTPRFDHDDVVVTIGQGREEFDRARRALCQWAQFDVGWVELFPRRAPIEPGTVIAVLIRHFGFWSLNGGRVVYGVNDQDCGTRFGLAYGTLTSHAESGEELFEVSLDAGSGLVTYRIAAASRPRSVLTRMGYPLVRGLQAQFRRDSAEAMRRAVSTR